LNASAKEERRSGTKRSLEVERIREVVKQICICRSNLILYSFKHAVAQKELSQTHRILTRILEDRESIGLDIFKTTLLFEGLPIEERNPMVGRLTRDFRKLHVRGITFHRGLTLKEVAILFKLLTLKGEELKEYGGVKELLKQGGVEHIGVNQTRYILLQEDQKVVSKSAHVAEGFHPGGEAVERELLHQLWEALLRRKVDRDWLLEEIRTDPAQVAGQIVALLKHYDDLEMLEHQEQRQEALDALMASVKTLGTRLAERESGGEEDEEQETVAQSLLVLEHELKARSAGLKTSKAAARFIQEITNTVTAFIDNMQAGQIAKEYLKDEKGLERTEQLLRKVIKRDPTEKIMPRLQKLMMEKGLTEKDFTSILERLSPRAPSPARKKKKRRPRAPRPIQEKLEKALAKRLESAEDKEKAISYLAGLYNRTVKAEVKEISEEKERLAAVLQQIDKVVSRAGLGLVIIDEEGAPVLSTDLARKELGDALGDRLEDDLSEFLTRGAISSDLARQSFLEGLGDEKKERYVRILEVVERPISDKAGRLLGLIIKASPPGQTQ